VNFEEEQYHMICIEAVIRPERIGAVTSALEDVGVPGFYYYNVTGQGRQAGVEVFVGRAGQVSTRSAVQKTCIRTIVEDGLKDKVIDAIIEASKSPGEGAIGDGKIFVTPMLDLARVRTNERGEAAL
jgi:nitrogen regulatory protein PII